MIITFCSFALLCVALSSDTFAAGLSYSVKKVHVPVISMGIISVISGFMFTLSLMAGRKIAVLIPHNITSFFSFFILMALALYKLYDVLPCKFHPSKELTTVSLSEKVNKNNPSVLSPMEAAALSVVLSIDSLTAGVSTGAPALSPALIFFLSSAIHFISIKLGLSAGSMILSRISCNFSWLSAGLFFLLALSRLF